MKYILDFDEVLFNTTKLKEKMAALGLSESVRGPVVFKQLQEAEPTFDVASLVFPGAYKFLLEHGDDCIIVSSALSESVANNTDIEQQIAFQEMKIVLSGVKDLAHEVYVVGVSKIEVLQTLQQQYLEEGHDLVFVDDREAHVRTAHELGIKTVLMDRKCAVGDGAIVTALDFPCVGSFADFAKVVDSWTARAT